MSSFPDLEECVLTKWKKQELFTKQLEQTSSGKPYVFYDGPPFATGKPHYGHILAGTMKDVVTRYHSMCGKYVPRQFGWDCHGLPVENIVDTTLNLQTDKQTISLEQYNQHCREVVMTCEKDWEYVVERMGRWVDFKNSYKTMDVSYMSHLWGIFKDLFDKNLIYQGTKVMPISTVLGTPLSNFEANLNYKDVSHTDAYVLFPLKEFKATYFVVWTTTPWTLVSHVALCLHPEKEYAIYLDSEKDKFYIVGKSFKVPSSWKLQDIRTGMYWKGTPYQAPFSYFPREYTVLCDSYVKDEIGTGIIHLSPCFGEEDDRICKQNDIPLDTFPCPVTMSGTFTSEIPEYQGKNVFDTNKDILKALKEKNLLWKQSVIHHSYPHCWRTDTPLIYRSVSSWFLRVESIRDKLVQNNQKVTWIPSHIGINKFQNWLEQSRDWALSRTRCWGTPIPIWASEDGKELVIISSKEELEELTGKTVHDLHRETIDQLEIPSKQGKGMLRRIPEVFDCWFESGSVPIVQSRKKGTEFVPADFVAEGIDQTRGWFYTMLVLATALYDSVPYKHVLCSGLVLAEDGKKMSKRLKNYPDPQHILHKYGADALRMYLLDSPVVKGEVLRFKEEGVYTLVKEILIPIQNAVKYYMEYKVPLYNQSFELSHPMDIWIWSYMEQFVYRFTQELEKYQLWNLVRYIQECVNKITNVYIRMNRFRFREQQPETTYVLHHVLSQFAKTVSPVIPFFAEWAYQHLSPKKESVHLECYPTISKQTGMTIAELEYMEVFQMIVEEIRKIRFEQKRSLKSPLRHVTIVYENETCLSYLREKLDMVLKKETNVQSITYEFQMDRYATKEITPNLSAIGKEFGKESKILIENIKKGIIDPRLSIGIHILESFQPIPKEGFITSIQQKILLQVDMYYDEIMKLEEEVREIIHLVGQARKESGYKSHDRCKLYISNVHEELESRLVEELYSSNTIVFASITSKWNYKDIFVDVESL